MIKKIHWNDKAVGWTLSYLLSILAIFGPILLVIFSIYLFGFWATVFLGICLFLFGFVALFIIAAVAQLADYFHHRFFRRS